MADPGEGPAILFELKVIRPEVMKNIPCLPPPVTEQDRLTTFTSTPMHMRSSNKCLVCCKIIIGTALSESLEPFEQEKGKTDKNLFWLE